MASKRGMVRRMAGGVLLAVALLATLPAAAARLTIGLGGDVTTLDPHHHILGPNNTVAMHVFDALIDTDDRQRPRPGLAEEWRALDPLTWEFRLRSGATFHDGRPVTAEDAVASLRRAGRITDSPLPFSVNLTTVAELTVIDERTFRVRTTRPDSVLPNKLRALAIIPARFEAASRADFDAGAAMIGSGPFRFVRWSKGDRIELAASTVYWAGRPNWEGVEIRIVPKSAQRIAALLTGTLDVIEQVPPSDVSRLGVDSQIHLFSRPSLRLFYLMLDSGRERSPFVTDRAGKPLDRNPLRDARVRRAISKAINRVNLVIAGMEGQAIPAGQFVPEGLSGHHPDLHPEPYDPKGAEHLLAEAGWPNGFALTLHAPNNRYVNDAALAKSMALMLSQVGIVTRVEALPAADFFPRASRMEFSAFFAGLNADTGEASNMMHWLVTTRDPVTGAGVSNRGQYSNPQVDALIDKALRTVDEGVREALLREAAGIAIGEVAVVPLFHSINVWATRRGLRITPRMDGYTFADGVLPVQEPAE
ncbi:MAG TPA: ABC transporter substrate-binding protein [Azospirillum sp.]|nr:ABC transporter substrate-binding protein [Azospirillum sp.]